MTYCHSSCKWFNAETESYFCKFASPQNTAICQVSSIVASLVVHASWFCHQDTTSTDRAQQREPRHNSNYHTHTRLTALCSRLPGWAGTRKPKVIWILLKQETVSDSGISWAICKSAPRSRQITTPAPHHSVFLQAGCPSCRPTNSVKALKAIMTDNN